MFNDQFDLTHSVLIKNKTMTRRKSATYKVGETVAIAQCYDQIWNLLTDEQVDEVTYMNMKSIYNGKHRHIGCTNKMYVKAEYMPHHILITGRRLQYLQDITDEEIMKEGCNKDLAEDTDLYWFDGATEGRFYATPREAFIVFIDKLMGKGTWEKNPRVWAYEFELVD